jgi:hypothetical protein
MNKKEKIILSIIVFAVVGLLQYEGILLKNIFNSRNNTIEDDEVISLSSAVINSDACQSSKKKGKVDYANFKSFKKYDDDYYVLKAAHECANKYNLKVEPAKAGEYHIRKNRSGDQERIKVETDTNLKNSTIYIHDEKNVITKCGVGNNYIFEIPGNYVNYEIKKVGKNVAPKNGEIEKGQKFIINDSYKQKALNKVKGCEKVKISEQKNVEKCITGFYVHVVDLNDSRRIFRRSKPIGQKSKVEESFTVDLKNIVKEDIQWTYKGANIKVIISAIPKKQLVFKDAIFRTVVSTKDVATYEVKRGIKISRNNIKVSNITHTYVKYVDSKYKTVHGTYYQYHNFYRFDQLAKVTFNNSIVHGMWRYKTSKPGTSCPKDKSLDLDEDEDYLEDDCDVSGKTACDMERGTYLGSYDLHMTNVVDMKLQKIKVSSTTDSLDKDYKVMGSSYTKDITYENCFLNRIDTHRGVYNLTIKNSTIGTRGILQLGYGKLTLENVTLKHTNTFVNLRHDYGSTWNGTVIVKGTNTIIPDNNNPVYLVSANPKCRHNYGYNLYLPKIQFAYNSKIVIKSKTKEFYIYDKTQQWFDKYIPGGNHKLSYSKPSNTNAYIFKNAKFTNINNQTYNIDNKKIFAPKTSVSICK